MVIGYALKFTARLSFNRLWKKLNESGPWHWRASDTDNYGDMLWCTTDEGGSLEIFGSKPNWTIQVVARDSVGQEAIDRVLSERVFPAVGARDVQPTDTVR
jgi:hypothetical protein